MHPYTTVTPYIVPMTTGDQATAAQNIYQQAITTAQAIVVPLRVVSLQRDLDGPPEGIGLAGRSASLSEFASMLGLSALIKEVPQHVAEKDDDVAMDTNRVLTAGRASHEWQQMTEPVGPGVQLPFDIED